MKKFVKEMDLFNFRDLGGLVTGCNHKIRDGIVYRTGNTTHLTQDAAVALKNKLQIEKYIDFRSHKEVGAFGKPDVLMNAGIDWVHLEINPNDPMFATVPKPNAEDWTGMYIRLFKNNIDQWVGFIHEILSTKNSMMYGCVLGKDRTGIATSLLLTTLDVHEEHVTRDYATTTDNMERRFYDRFVTFWGDVKMSHEETFHHYLAAHPEIIQGFVKYLREQDEEIYQLLSKHGMKDEHFTALREKMLLE
jgi:protein-tyrosine phosphatase